VNATEGYWEQSRQAVRAKAVETGVRLFLEQGFDETTTQQIAEEVGISSRSLFRYVATKEDLVLGHLEQQGDLVAEALAARPADEHVWDALRAALDSLRHLPEYDEAHQLKLMKMVYASPSLRARYMDKRMSWIELLSPEVARRLAASGVREPEVELAARAVVGAALTCLTLAFEAWAAHDGQDDLGALYDAALAAVRA